MLRDKKGKTNLMISSIGRAADIGFAGHGFDSHIIMLKHKALSSQAISK